MSCDIHERPALSQIEMEERWIGVGTKRRLERGSERKGQEEGELQAGYKIKI